MLFKLIVHLEYIEFKWWLSQFKTWLC